MTSEPSLRARPNKPGDLQLAPVGHFNLLSVTIRKVIWDERGFVLLFCFVGFEGVGGLTLSSIILLPGAHGNRTPWQGVHDQRCLLQG